MANFERTIKDLVIANRILADQGIVDAFGEISVRHSSDRNRFLLARAASPAAVVAEDILEFAIDGTPFRAADPLPAERFLHAALYEARSDVVAVLHASPDDVLPFGITTVPPRLVIGTTGDMGGHVPVWDISANFGDGTDLTVSNIERGRDLARCLGKSRVAVLRGAGFIVTGRTLNDVVRLSTYVPRNARTIVAAAQSGTYRTLSAGEVEARYANPMRCGAAGNIGRARPDAAICCD
jgi:ribulose-5-phosphate 4-epimerase/fuculose-1-phosphate aldolase